MPWVQSQLEAERGSALRGLGLLLVAGEGHAERALSVRFCVGGEAVERGLVRPSAVSVRPFSARLAPWQAALWSAPLREEGGVYRAELPALRWYARPDGPPRVTRPGPVALWCEVAAAAGDEGAGFCSLEALGAGLGEGVRAQLGVRVGARVHERYWRCVRVLEGEPSRWRERAQRWWRAVAQSAQLGALRATREGGVKAAGAHGALWGALEPWREDAFEGSGARWSVVLGPVAGDAQDAVGARVREALEGLEPREGLCSEQMGWARA